MWLDTQSAGSPAPAQSHNRTGSQVRRLGTDLSWGHRDMNRIAHHPGIEVRDERAGGLVDRVWAPLLRPSHKEDIFSGVQVGHRSVVGIQGYIFAQRFFIVFIL